MKKVIFLAMLLPLPAYGQIMENFETGTLQNWSQSTDNHWKADTSKALSGKYSLHHCFDNSVAGNDQAGINIDTLHPEEGDVTWSFLIRHGYDPSSQNNWSVFLMSDNSPVSMSPDGGTKGFAIGVNLTGSDDSLRLWKLDGTKLTVIVSSGINWQSDIGSAYFVKIMVIRSKTGNWTVNVFRSDGTLINNSTGSDSQLFPCNWFGVYYKYSSTRDRLLWIDDIGIEGPFFADNDPPQITECKILSKKSVQLILSEKPLGNDISPETVLLNNKSDIIESVRMIDGTNYVINFKSEFINHSSDSITIKKLCDESGNCVLNTIIVLNPDWAVTGDVVISEIMADPDSPVSLPDKEYLELTNRTGYSFNLKNWKLSTDNQYVPFPELILNPHEIAILCSYQDTSSFKTYGKVLGLKQFPVLTDGGRLIYLSDSAGTLIHGVEYSSDWYGDELKSDGGWSLEMVDTDYPFNDKNNWKASVSPKGGTPGSVNSVKSVNKDDFFEGISNVFPIDSVSVRLRLSEPVFNLQTYVGKIKSDGLSIKSISSEDPLMREYMLISEIPLSKSTVYRFKLPVEVCDFAGNIANKDQYLFGLPEEAAGGDIMFNEILFNPLPDDPDYLELYNCSQNIVDVSKLLVGSINDETGAKSKTLPVYNTGKCFMPGEYFAISTSGNKTLSRYFSSDPDHLFTVSSLPSMPDDKGHLILYNKDLRQIDEMLYDDKMQFALLSDHEGVALEKINPLGKSEEPENWHSATEVSGWGTPGAPNSVYDIHSEFSRKVNFSSTKITPDNDGNDDFLTITLNTGYNTNIINISVYDETGNFIRKVATNLFAGTDAALIWDGTADDGSMVSTGIYIILINVYDDKGHTSSWKRVCTVIR